MNIQERICEILIKQATEQGHPLLSLLSGKNAQDACFIVFASYRGAGKGMRLTDEGLQLMKTFFKTHDVKLVGGYSEKLQHLLYLDRTARMPYWLNNHSITLMDAEFAMMLRLVEGNIQSLIETGFRLEIDDSSGITR